MGKMNHLLPLSGAMRVNETVWTIAFQKEGLTQSQKQVPGLLFNFSHSFYLFPEHYIGNRWLDGKNNIFTL